MSSPKQSDMHKLRRFGRYVKGRPRAIQKFAWQANGGVVDIYSDANWAGCHVSRKSTSGGAILIGDCCIRSYSKTQSTIAQSSAESELLGVVRAATEALGIIALAKDLGIYSKAQLHVDASAAIGILERKGVGRVRHLDVGTSWLQEQQLK